MICLPRGNPVRDKVNPARINLPEAMAKLRAANYTGYLRFDASEGSGVIIFTKGKLVSALFVNAADGERLIAYDAIARIFEISILGHATLNIFRLAPNLALGVHALLHGRYIYRGQELNLLDVRALLDRIKKEEINGCLRVYSGDRVAVIYYDHGAALGFFHDGGENLSRDADLQKSVARLPGARLDLLETANIADLALADLMASADLGPIWQRARKVLLGERERREEAAIRAQKNEVKQK